MTPDPAAQKNHEKSSSSGQRKNKTPLDSHEVTIIVTALGALTIALISGRISEGTFSALMGAFMGYTFGRIFNGWQGKE